MQFGLQEKRTALCKNATEANMDITNYTSIYGIPSIHGIQGELPDAVLSSQP